MIRGTLDGKVRIVRLVGRGGMGAVYEAEDLRSGQRVAVKVMHARAAHDDDDDGGNLGRFLREERAAAAIDSEHVTRVLDWGTDPARDAPYMVLEYLEGEDLHALLKRTGALRPEVALRILAQACLGVQKAHEARIIHRDIKPANLFLAAAGDGDVVVKILDFGIAKIRPERDGGETTGLTRTGGMLGSPIYMSPEQARGLKAIDYRTDIWSLGVVLYRALSGHTPHDESEAVGDLIVSICSNAPRPVQEIAPWVPAPVAAVVHGALQIHPDDRWPSAAAMLDAIRPLLPDGWALRKDMLVPVDDALRATIAPRSAEQDQATTGFTGRRQAAAAASVPPPPPPAPPPLVASEAPESTGDPVPASTATPRPRRSRWQARAAGVAAVTALSGGAVYLAATSARRIDAANVGTPTVTLSAELRAATASGHEVPGADGGDARPSAPALTVSPRGASTPASAQPDAGAIRPGAPRPPGAPRGGAVPPAPANPGPGKPLMPDRFE